MIWLTWRQSRAQTITAITALAAIAIALAITGPHVADLYKSSGLSACRGQAGCGNAASTFVSDLVGTSDSFLFNLCIAVMYLAPGLIGVFWGAPLITRELEANTFRLAWTQSVTRSRWIAVKLGTIGLATMVTAGLLS